MKKERIPESDYTAPTKAMLEQERKILLELGNDITRVREKNELIV